MKASKIFFFFNEVLLFYIVYGDNSFSKVMKNFKWLSRDSKRKKKKKILVYKIILGIHENDFYFFAVLCTVKKENN